MMVKEKHSLLQWFCLTGILGLVFYILHMVIGTMYYPGYDWMRQAVSDLTAANAPSKEIAGSLSEVYGLFNIVSCTLVCVFIQSRGNKPLRIGIDLFTAMNWVSSVGYTLFSLSDSGYAGKFQDIMHVYVITILVVVLSIVSLILIAVGGFSDHRRYLSLGVCALIALALMMAGAVGTGIVPKAYFGVVERFSTLSATAFSAVLGLYGFAFFDRIERDGRKNSDIAERTPV